MALQPGPDDLRLLKDKVFRAAIDNKPQVIQDCLASLHPDVVKDILHHCSLYKESKSTPLIIAAWKGHLETVQILVNEFNVDVNQKVSCSFEMRHALISAAWQGHLDIVKVLVSNGCDISSASRYGQTAVSVAICENHLDILKYLVENGAAIDEYLMNNSIVNACLNGKLAMVQYLLSKGADPNQPFGKGRTLLHWAARENLPDIIRLLLQHGARFTKDRFGRSPLMEAALNASSNAVRVFLECLDLSQLEKIESLELLGAELALANINEAFMNVREAMEERHRNPASVLPKPYSLLPTLTNVQESQTLEELQVRQSDQHLFRLECLAILSRILGPDDSHTVNGFNRYSDELQFTGHHSEAVTVLLHGVKAAIKYSTDPVLTGYLLCELSLKFVLILQNESLKIFSDLEGMIESTLEIMEKNASFVLLYPADARLLLSYFLIALKVAQGQEEGRRLQRLTKRFLCLSSGFPVLHTAVGLKWNRPHGLRDLDDLPYDLLVSFLLHCGADVHCKDCNRNTALHIAAYRSQIGEDFDLVSRLMGILLDAGALVGLKNNEGQTPLDMAGPALAGQLRELYPVSLKSLAATIIVEHNIPYIGEVPEDLEEFTEKH